MHYQELLEYARVTVTQLNITASGVYDSVDKNLIVYNDTIDVAWYIYKDMYKKMQTLQNLL